MGPSVLLALLALFAETSAGVFVVQDVRCIGKTVACSPLYVSMKETELSGLRGFVQGRACKSSNSPDWLTIRAAF